MTKKQQGISQFAIYYVIADGEQGLVEVSDPLHIAILNHLSKGPMSTTEISEFSGKAQSTLSVHLDQMVNQHLISSEYDKNDSRRKIFTLTSRMVVSNKEPSSEGVEEASHYLDKAIKSDSDRFYECLLRAILMNAEASGMDITPMMEGCGARFAMAIVPTMTSTKVEDVIRVLQEFYEKNNIGEVCIYTFMPLTVIVRDYEETQWRFDSFAAFSRGLFKTLLSQVIGKKYEITKSEIFGTGNNYYKFVIELAQ